MKTYKKLCSRCGALVDCHTRKKVACPVCGGQLVKKK